MTSVENTIHKRALIVTSTAGFAKGFLLHDMYLLRTKGFEVHCAANGRGMSFNPNEVFDKCDVLFHQIDFSSTKPLSSQSYKSYKQIRALLKKYNFNIVHCHTPIVGAIVRMAVAPFRKKGCKVIYTSHGLAFHNGAPLKNKLIFGGVEWLCSGISDAIITINMEDYKIMKKMLCKNVFHINGVGVNTKRFQKVLIDRDSYRKTLGISSTDIMILAVGELSVRKNQQIIIKALAELANPQCVFVICGKEMESKGIAENIRKLADESNVRLHLLGFRTDIPEITNCADIAVLPSLREGLGLAGIEALASGVPVVGSSIQGIKDYVVEGETGYLCNPTDAHEFAKKIQLLITPDSRKKMRKACVAKAEQFSTKVSWHQMEEIYNKIVE